MHGSFCEDQWLQADMHHLLCELPRYATDGTLEKAISMQSPMQKTQGIAS